MKKMLNKNERILNTYYTKLLEAVVRLAVVIAIPVAVAVAL